MGESFEENLIDFENRLPHAPGLDHADALRHRGRGVHGVGGGHALHPDGVAAPYAHTAHHHLAGAETGVFCEGVAVSVVVS